MKIRRSKMSTERVSHERSSTKGFTLIELLIVIGIMTILFSVVVGVTKGTSDALGLTTTGDSLYNKLVEVQQRAIAKNQDIEVRFYSYADEFGVVDVRGLGFVEEVIDGNTSKKIQSEAPFIIPTPYVISSGKASNGEKLSTLTDPLSGENLNSSTGSASTPPLFPPDDSAPYTSFLFRPDGSTNLGPTTLSKDQWHITLVIPQSGTSTNSLTDTPTNFYTIRLDPYTGRLEKWRP